MIDNFIKRFILIFICCVLINNSAFADDSPIYCPTIDELQIAPDGITVSTSNGWQGKVTSGVLPDNFRQLPEIIVDVTHTGRKEANSMGYCQYREFRRVGIRIMVQRAIPVNYSLYGFILGSGYLTSCLNSDPHDHYGDCYFFSKSIVK